MFRFICFIIGYAFGLIQTGYFYSRSKGVDIRKVGSGNSGATNTLRVMGKKAGIIVFFGDGLKAFIPCLITRLIVAQFAPGAELLYMAYLGLGVVIGHNYPFYLKFKGGKGIAATSGIALALDLRIAAVMFVTFFTVAFVTEYVSLASLLIMMELAVLSAVFQHLGWFGLSAAYTVEFDAIMLIFFMLALWRHRTNIGRLLSGTENKTHLLKKK